MPKITCPECKTTNTARIIAGEYDVIIESKPELKQKIDEGKLYPRGCLVDFPLYNRHCNECGLEFDTRSEKDLSHRI